MSEQGNTSTLPRPGPACHGAAGWGDLLSGRNAVYALALGGSVALHALNIYIATTIMPSVVADIGGLDYYAWSTTLFVVASILGAALSGRLLNRAGAQRAYALAALVFGVGTLLCALAPSMPVMLAGRFVQGFGGGFLYALAYGVIRLVFPERLWARAIGLISAMWGISTLVGPAVGGVFAEFGAWRAAFWSLIPLVALFGLMALMTLPRRSDGERLKEPLPAVQLLLLTAAVLVVSAGCVGTDLMWNMAGVAGAFALVGLLIVVEIRSDVRLLPTGALDVTRPMGALYATGALLVIGMQPEIFVPYLLQILHAQSPLIAGYLAALMALGWTLGSMVSGSWSGDGANRAILAGPSFSLVGLVLLTIFLPIDSAGAWGVVAATAAGLALVGFGIGFAWPHLVTRVFQSAPQGEQERAATSVTTVQLFATALGAAVAGMVVNLAGITEPGGAAGASRAAFWLFLLFSGAPVICLFTALRVRRAA